MLLTLVFLILLGIIIFPVPQEVLLGTFIIGTVVEIVVFIWWMNKRAQRQRTVDEFLAKTESFLREAENHLKEHPDEENS